MGSLEVESGRRIYVEHHPGDGRPVVLVHGWGVDGRCWDTTLGTLLEAGHEVVIFDARCCGRSDKDFADISPAAGVADVLAVVAATTTREPVLVGWSLGAVAAAGAAAAPDSGVAGLFLVCPATPRFAAAADFPHGADAAEVAATLRGLRDNRPDFLHGVAERIGSSDLSPNAVEWIWQQFMSSSPRADLALAELVRIDQRELLAGIDAPSLVLSGGADSVIDPDVHRYCADLLPNARLVELPRSGHAPFLDQRTEFDRVLLEFLADPAACVRAADAGEPSDPVDYFG